MNGYKKLVNDLIVVATALIAANVSILEMILPEDLGTAVFLLYEFLTMSGSWIGYVIAAVYFFGLDLGYAEYLCMAAQYGYIVVYYLNYAVTLGQNA